MENQYSMREAMDIVHRAQKEFTEACGSDALPFKGPHCGVHIRRWKNGRGKYPEPAITIECDPGYCGIGAALTPSEARRLGAALLRAADAAKELAAETQEEDTCR